VDKEIYLCITCALAIRASEQHGGGQYVTALWDSYVTLPLCQDLQEYLKLLIPTSVKFLGSKSRSASVLCVQS
jgi:hypothetical protein